MSRCFLLFPVIRRSHCHTHSRASNALQPTKGRQKKSKHITAPKMINYRLFALSLLSCSFSLSVSFFTVCFVTLRSPSAKDEAEEKKHPKTKDQLENHFPINFVGTHVGARFYALFSFLLSFDTSLDNCVECLISFSLGCSHIAVNVNNNLMVPF